MKYNLENKKVLVTGSTDGLGKLLAIELDKLGAKVIIHGKDKNKIDKTIGNLSNSNKFVLCDLRNSVEVKEKFSEIKELDILINNAGIWAEGNTIDITEERIIELVNVNLASYLLVTRTLLPTLLKSDFSQILNVVSVAGIEIPSGFYHTIYSATKYGLQGFSEAMAKEFEGKNMRVMGYYPGGMNTNLFVKSGENYKENEPWMFDPIESAEAIIFMLTRNPKVNVKRMDLINHMFE
jgi:3-oxoacyl-[acyl-carrier protein] reductase